MARLLSCLRFGIGQCAIIFLLLLAIPPPTLATAGGWQNIDLRGMGFVTGILAHPITGEIYVRTDVGGVFRWDAATARWGALLDAHGIGISAARNVESLALDPRDPLRLYVAYGTYVEDGQGPNGILRSDDGGATWRNLEGFSTSIEQGGNSAWRHAGERLVVDPANSNVLYFGTRQNGLWRSVDAGVTWARIATSLPLGGNHGALRNGLPQNGGVTFVAVDSATITSAGGPARSSTLYVGIMEEGVWRSTDGGQTFALLSVQPAADASPIQGRLASDGTLYVTLTGGVWRWRGGVWTVITPPVSGYTYTTREWAGLAVDPTNPDRVAINDNGNTVRDLFLSTNGGASWRVYTSDDASAFPAGSHRAVSFVIPDWIEESAQKHSYSGAMLFAPSDPARLWVTTGYAVYVYENLAANPVRANSRDYMAGLEELVGLRAQALPAAWGGGVVLGAMDKGGFLIRDPAVVPRAHLGTRAIANLTGLGVSAGTDTIAAAFSDHEYKDGDLLASDDRGHTWRRLGPHPSAPASGYGMALGGNIAVSATAPSRLVWIPFNASWYSGGNHRPVFSVDGGATWQLANGFDYGGFPVGFTGANNIYNGSSSVLAADAVDGMTFYAYHEHTSSPYGGSIFRSTDGGANWTLVAHRSLPSYWLAHLEARPGAAGELWFTDRATSLQRSTDGGATWRTVGGWQNVAAFGFGAALPGNNQTTLYASGRRGGDTSPSVYYSGDDGATWTRVTGAGAAPLDMVVGVCGDMALPGRIYLATSGRGFFYVDLLGREIGEPPVFTQEPKASANPVLTASTVLSAAATDAETPGDTLTYAWTVVSAPPGGTVTFDVDRTSSAAITTATFTATGGYTLRCTVTDADLRTAQADLALTVSGILGSLAIEPSAAELPLGGALSFTAFARTTHGLRMNEAPKLTWSSTGGTIDADGNFTTGDFLGGPYVVRASTGGLSAESSLRVVPANSLFAVIRWKGDYVTAHQDFRASTGETNLDLDGGSSANDRRRRIPWSLTTPYLTPGPSYAGASARFYGGLQRIRLNSSSTPTLPIAAVRANGGLGDVAADGFALRTQTGGGATTATHAFFVWLKEDFVAAHRDRSLCFAREARMRVRAGDGGEADFSARWNNVAQARWVVREGDKWYVSQTAFTQLSDAARTLVFSADDQDGAWAEIDPAANLNLDLASLAYAPRDFADLTAFGFYLENDAQGTGDFYACIDEFTVEVAPRVPAFAGWQQAAWPDELDATVIGPLADPDRDGVCNLLEYALGGDARAPTSAPRPSVSTTGGRLALTFNRARPDLAYVVEASDDLRTWTTIAIDPGAVGAEVMALDTQPLKVSSRRFFRLRVEMLAGN